MSEDAVSVASLARILGVHRNTVYTKATTDQPAPAGAFPGFKVGRVWRFYPSEVKAHLRQSTDPWSLPTARRGRTAA